MPNLYAPVNSREFFAIPEPDQRINNVRSTHFRKPILVDRSNTMYGNFGHIYYADYLVTCLAIAVAVFVCLMPIYKKPAKGFCCFLAMLCFYLCLFFRAAGSPIEWHATTIVAMALVFGLQFGICYLTYYTVVPQ